MPGIHPSQGPLFAGRFLTRRDSFTAASALAGGLEVFYTDADIASAGTFDDADISLTTQVQLPAGTITKIRWRAPATLGTTTPLARLYDSSGTLLASASFDTLTPDTWNYATLSLPISIAAGTYYPTVYCNRYRAVTGFFTGGSITRGSFTAGQGRFRLGDLSPVAGTTSTAAYLVDAEFTTNTTGPGGGGILNQSNGTAPRNGTTSHTIPFAFASTPGNELVVLIFGAVTNTASGWTERLQPANAGELSVFTKTSTGESSITVTHNASDYAVDWAVYELPAGSSWVNGIGDAAATSDTFPALGSLPGTPVMVWAARGRVAGTGGATAGASAWTSPWVEDTDIFTATNVTNGAYLTVARQIDVTSTTITPSATTTYTGSWTTTNRQHVVFAMTVPTVTPPTVTAGIARPVINSGSISLDVTATPPGGQTITGHSWVVQSGGGTLTNANTATPTYTAPSSGVGVAIIRDTVTASNNATATADVSVGYGPNIVAAENTLTGTPRATWDLASPNLAGVTTLQGFCDGFTADKSATVNFKIAQSDTAGWSADIYRLGYYGGNGARFYGTLTPNGTQLTNSQAQPTPTDVDPVTSNPSVDCGNWSTTLTWTPPSWAPSGMYVLRLNRTGGGASHVMFIVRDDSRTANMMFMPADSTWQAYNAFGGMGASLLNGNSLYNGTSVDQYNTDAARFISYNRPFVNRAAANVGQSYGAVEWSTFFTGEYPMLRFLERNGFDVKYYGCIDAASDSTGTKLANVNAAMFVGHNEYWSDGMRSGWEAAKASGTNIFSCASNEVFWRLVGSNNDSGGRPRTWECYKSTIASRASTGQPQWTGTWRDPDGAGKGGNNPENTFTGTIFVVNGPDLHSIVVPFDGGYSQQPLWRHTSVATLTSGQNYTSPNQILGFEWDTYGPAGTNGAGAAFMAPPHSLARYCSDVTYTVSGPLLIDAGDVYGTGNATHRLVVHPGGNSGIVFGTGTINWALGVDNANTYQMGNDNTDIVIQQATVNMLVDMGASPSSLMAGLTAPTKTVWFPSSVTLTTATITTSAPTVTASAAASVSLTPAVLTLSAPPLDVIIPGAPWVRNSTQSGTGAGTSLTHSVAIPTCQVGDDLWASFTLNGGHGAVTDPAGWTRVFPTTITDDGFMSLLVYRKTATSTEVAGGNVTVTVGTAVRGNAGAVSIADADTGALDGSTSSFSGVTGTATTSTSFSTATTNTLVLSIVALDSGVEVATSPALTTERWNPTRSNITGQANAGATALKVATGSSSWNWTWPTSLAWKTWAGAVKSVATASSSVTLTPAVMTTSATSVAAVPGPTSVTLTPITQTVSAVSVTATSGAISVTLSPITRTVTAVSVVVTPGVTLSPITRTMTAVSVVATPVITLTPATITASALSVTTVPGSVSISLSPAVLTINVLPLGAGGVSVIALTPAQLTLNAPPLSVSTNALTVTVTPALLNVNARTISAALVPININIVPAQATILTNPVSLSGVVSLVTLTPASFTVTAAQLGVHDVTIPGVDLMTIAFVTVTGVGEYIRGELVATEGGVPKRFAHVVPGQIAWDNCDCGQFAQTINSVASSRVFPAPASDIPDQPCGHPLAVVSVTVSLLRCVPGLDSNGNAPSVLTLLETARIIEEDRQVLRRSVAQHLNVLRDEYKIVNYTVGTAQSVGPEGQCGGIELTYSFGINNDAMVC